MLHTVKSVSDFDKQLSHAGNKLVVVDFYATWCGPCSEIDPKVKSLSRKYGSQIVVLKVNVDHLSELVDKYRVTCMPTFIFIKNKTKLSGLTGSDEDKLERRVLKMIRAA